jgi:hypothetical protein
MIFATLKLMMEEKEYNELVKQRDTLKGLKPVLPKHKEIVRKQLETIRTKLSNAHRESYRANK